MQGFGVLPGPPAKARITTVDVDFAIITWEPPKTLGDSVFHYNVHYRPVQQGEYRIIREVSVNLFQMQ